MRGLKPTQPTEDNSDDEESQSPVWNYFERDGKNRARCAVCCTKMYNNLDSLVSHLKCKHPKLLAEMSPQQVDTKRKSREASMKRPENASSRNGTPDPFKDDGERYGSDKDYDPGEDAHSGSENSGSEHQEAQEEEEIYTDVIYLEENPKESLVKEKKEKRDTSYLSKTLPSTSRYNTGRKRSRSQSSEEIVYKKRRNSIGRRHTSFMPKHSADNDDAEIESFGSYVVCLLKKLPRKLSMKLQRDIINLIMNANLEEQSDEMPKKIVLDGSKIYMVPKNDGNGTAGRSTDNAISDGTTVQNYEVKVVADNENPNGGKQLAVNKAE